MTILSRIIDFLLAACLCGVLAVGFLAVLVLIGACVGIPVATAVYIVRWGWVL